LFFAHLEASNNVLDFAVKESDELELFNVMFFLTRVFIIKRWFSPCLFVVAVSFYVLLTCTSGQTA